MGRKPSTVENDPEIDRELIAGQKIGAIRRYRSATNASLTDALKAVNDREAMLRQSGRLPPRPARPARFWITLALGAFVLLVLLGAMLQIFTVGRALIPG